MIANRLKALRKEKNKTQSEIARSLGVAPTTYASWEQGKREPDLTMINKISSLFDVSTDYLLGNSEKKHYYDLNEDEKTDLGKLADQMLKGTDVDAESDYFGEPSTDAQKASLRAAILTAMEMNKKEAKKKFTPKKYRDTDGNNE